jgi:hypothetical protein
MPKLERALPVIYAQTGTLNLRVLERRDLNGNSRAWNPFDGNFAQEYRHHHPVNDDIGRGMKWVH